VQDASPCGHPALGPETEEGSCNSDIKCDPTFDCEFNDWADWSQCSTSCSGLKSRSRGIKHYGSGNGGFCEGAVHDLAPCHEHGTDCGGAEPVDCILNAWAEWTTCDAECGRGEKERTRTVAQEPANGGKVCDGGLKELHTCQIKKCAEQCDAVDCVWGDWGDWSYCEHCTAQRKRYRHIATHPACGGEVCQPKPTEEVGDCGDVCRNKRTCVWQEWGDFGPCSVTCGKGLMSRTRHLAFFGGHPTTTTTTTTTTALDIGADFADIEAEAKAKIGDIEPAVFGEVPTTTPGLIATLPPFTAPTIPPPPTIAPIVTLPPPEIPAIAPIATVAPPVAAAPITTAPFPVDDEQALEHLLGRYEELKQQREDVSQLRFQDLVVAYLAGCASLVLGLVAVRAAWRVPYRENSDQRPLLREQREVDV